MGQTTTDSFDYVDAQRGKERCLLGIAGFSHSGKTYSALRLAAGLQRVYGGDIAVVDSEEAAQWYAEKIRFKHIRFPPPHGSDRWRKAIDFALGKGAKVIVLDNLSDEHAALLDAHEAVLDERAGDNWAQRDKWTQAAWARVKPARQKLERHIFDASKNVPIICLWKADKKYTPKKRDKGARVDPAEEHTWKMETSSKLLYHCQLRWLLRPGADGVPVPLEAADNDDERRMMKIPGPFRNLMRPKALDESLGEAIGRVCLFGETSVQTTAGTPARAKFHREYKQASGDLADSDPPELDAYLAWLSERPGTPACIAHMDVVRATRAAIIREDCAG